MTGTPNILSAPAPASAKGVGSVAARAGARDGSTGSEDAPSSFEAVLTGLRPGAQRKDRESGDERVADRGATIANPPPQSGRPLPAIGDSDEAAAAEPGRSGTTITVEIAQPGREGALVTAVADRIAAAIAPAQSPAAADAMASPAAGPDRHGQAASIVRAGVGPASWRRDVAETAGEARFSEVSVRRRETHLVPALSRTGLEASVGRAERSGAGSAEAPVTSGTAPNPEPARHLHGRAEQMLTGMRTGHDQARAGGTGASASSAARPLAEEARLFKGPDDPNAGALRAPAPEVAASGQPAAGTSRPAGPPAEMASMLSAPVGTSTSYQVTASGPVKVLQIQLRPAELGMLEVSMRLTDAGLEVHIEASRHEAFALLKSDRDALANVLRTAGHAIDTVTVTLSERGGPQTPAAQQDGSAAWGFGDRPDARPGSGREQGAQSADRAPPRPEDGPDIEQVQDDQGPTALSARDRGHVYL